LRGCTASVVIVVLRHRERTKRQDKGNRQSRYSHLSPHQFTSDPGILAGI
jgi:hypothetical protein